MKYHPLESLFQAFQGAKKQFKLMNYAEVGLGLDLSQSHSLLPLSLNVFPAECLNQAKT